MNNSLAYVQQHLLLCDATEKHRGGRRSSRRDGNASWGGIPRNVGKIPAGISYLRGILQRSSLFSELSLLTTCAALPSLFGLEIIVGKYRCW